MQTTHPIHYAKDADGIVTLTIDCEGQKVNTMNAAFKEALGTTLTQLEAEKDSITGVMIASAKSTFFAGGDLNALYKVQKADAPTFFASTLVSKGNLRRLEKLGKPVVALLNGTALGGGFEIALACMRRIAVNDAKIQFGLPEASLGLLPGAGGVVRMNWLLGLEKAQPYLQDSKLMTPAEAHAAGLVHQLVNSSEEIADAGRAWIKANPSAKQPWDTEGYAVPGGRPGSANANRWIASAAPQVRAKTKGCYPAPEAILCASVEAMQVDFDTAMRVEARYFTGLVTGSVAKNIIGTFWFQANHIKNGGDRPKDVPPAKFQKVGILGAGMMGAGIAYVAANRGLDVIVKDMDLASATKAKTSAEKLLQKRLDKGEIAAEKQSQILSRIQPTDNYADMAGCDIVVEAVLERPPLKAEVTQALEPQLANTAIWASNTSTLPITGLAEASTRPANFIGLHFFSPVPRMALVEVIVGKQTSQETLARALDFVAQIGKTPIVVNDSRGFFTSRVFSTFTREGVAMLGEGQIPESIEAAAMFAGFPVGPLAVLDEVSLKLSFTTRTETLKAYAAEGRPLLPHPADQVMERMLGEFGRAGRAAGGGFYDYPEGGGKVFWPGLVEHFPRAKEQASQQDKRDRLLFCMALEAVRALEEGVLNTAGDGNIGSCLGIGYPRWTGGVFQFLNQYGLPQAVARAEELAAKYGARFAAPQLLKTKAERNEPF